MVSLMVLTSDLIDGKYSQDQFQAALRARRAATVRGIKEQLVILDAADNWRLRRAQTGGDRIGIRTRHMASSQVGQRLARQAAAAYRAFTLPAARGNADHVLSVCLPCVVRTRAAPVTGAAIIRQTGISSTARPRR